MSRRLGRRAGAAVTLVLVGLVATPASPAAADPVITIDSPRADPPLGSATVTISGSVTSSAPLLNMVKRITATIEGRAPFTKECTQTPCSFSWTPPAFASNGPYEVVVTAVEATRLIGLEGATSTQSRGFSVAAPAARPVLDTPRVNEARNVELSWSRNTEPDMLYYGVFRKDPGGSDYKTVPRGLVEQPRSGTKVSFTDTSTSAFNGGDYAYQVVAVRRGANSASGSEKASEPSAVVTASVPVPPTTTSPSTTSPVPGAPPGATGPTTTAKPGSTSGVDLSGFLSSRSQPTPLTPLTVPEPPDTGFSGSLPFGPGEDLEEGEEDAVPPNDRRSTSVISRISPGRPLVPVAGGLVLLLLAMHMRILGHRIKPVAEGDLPVDAGAAPLPPATVTPLPLVAIEPEPEPGPAPALYDVEEWSLADEDWAPEPEPEPEPEPVALWAPPVAGSYAEPGPEPGPGPPDPTEIEVFEVVSSPRRRLARAGSR